MTKVQPTPTAISPEQCRAARAALNLTTTDVIAALGMGQATLAKFEAGGEVRQTVPERLRDLFEARGIVFADDGLGLTWLPPAS